MINKEDFVHSPERRAELAKGLTPKQAKMANHWMDLFDLAFNVGDFVKMDEFFHPDMQYGNPNRLDLPTYAKWTQKQLISGTQKRRQTRTKAAGLSE